MNRRTLFSAIAALAATTPLAAFAAKRGLADGGPVKPGKMYLVGERGPELILPHARRITLSGIDECGGYFEASYETDAGLAGSYQGNGASGPYRGA